MAVISTAGHDRSRLYLVVTCREKIAGLADGDTRSIAAPKRKRVTHMKPVAMIEEPEKFFRELGNIGCVREKDTVIRKTLAEITLRQEEKS